MHTFLNTPFTMGSFQLPNRLIQGPLAGFSCSPFRELFHHFQAPAYTVTEMISSSDILYKHPENSRYLHRGIIEKILAYQISGNDPQVMAKAAKKLDALGADIIDINCGCPKLKIRKKRAGSALLEEPDHIVKIITSVRSATNRPITVKIRLINQGFVPLAQKIEKAGADAIIVHGRTWLEDYDKPNDLEKIRQIKQAVTIPVIANGDICDSFSLEKTINTTGCDAYMISRAGNGKPWLYKNLIGLYLNAYPLLN
jgi:tRNA-dihydrouridine synthase B